MTGIEFIFYDTIECVVLAVLTGIAVVILLTPLRKNGFISPTTIHGATRKRESDAYASSSKSDKDSHFRKAKLTRTITTMVAKLPAAEETKINGNLFTQVLEEALDHSANKTQLFLDNELKKLKKDLTKELDGVRARMQDPKKVSRYIKKNKTQRATHEKVGSTSNLLGAVETTANNKQQEGKKKRKKRKKSEEKEIHGNPVYRNLPSQHMGRVDYRHSKSFINQNRHNRLSTHSDRRDTPLDMYINVHVHADTPARHVWKPTLYYHPNYSWRNNYQHHHRTYEDSWRKKVWKEKKSRATHVNE